MKVAGKETLGKDFLLTCAEGGLVGMIAAAGYFLLGALKSEKPIDE